MGTYCFFEVDNCHCRFVAHPAHGVGQPAIPPIQAARSIDLPEIAGENHFGTETRPSDDGLHLMGGKVLGFINNDERTMEGLTPNEIQAFVDDLVVLFHIHYQPFVFGVSME